MIPPVTGNGMSMAFESAEIAIEPLTRYSRGEISWAQARDTIARKCDAAFAERLTWARRLQWLMFSPVLRLPGKPCLPPMASGTSCSRRPGKFEFRGSVFSEKPEKS